METASSMEASPAVKPTPTAATEAAAVPTTEPASAFISASAVVTAAIAVAVMAAAVVTTIVAAVAVEAMEPRTRADKGAPYEPVRTVVTIGCTCVRIVAVVAVSAYGSGTHVCRANTHTDHHALRVRVRRAEQENSKQTDEP